MLSIWLAHEMDAPLQAVMADLCQLLLTAQICYLDPKRCFHTGASEACKCFAREKSMPHTRFWSVSCTQGSRDYNQGEGPEESVLQAAEDLGIVLPDGFQARMIDHARDIVVYDLLLAMDKFTSADVLREVNELMHLFLLFACLFIYLFTYYLCICLLVLLLYLYIYLFVHIFVMNWCILFICVFASDMTVERVKVPCIQFWNFTDFFRGPSWMNVAVPYKVPCADCFRLALSETARSINDMENMKFNGERMENMENVLQYACSGVFRGLLC